MAGKCSRCGRPNPGRRVGRYCRACQAAYLRDWRKKHPLEGKAYERDIVRSYAHVYKTRGKLVPQPCAVCGETKVEMHHPDYSQPLLVVWLCRKHHVAWHNFERRENVSQEMLEIWIADQRVAVTADGNPPL